MRSCRDWAGVGNIPIEVYTNSTMSKSEKSVKRFFMLGVATLYLVFVFGFIENCLDEINAMCFAASNIFIFDKSMISSL